MAILAIVYDMTGKINNEKNIIIPGGSATKIITYLSNINLNMTILDPRILSMIGHAQVGYLELSGPNLRKIDFFYEITTAKPVSEEITLIPGETTVVFLKQLAKNHNLNFSELEAEYNKTAPFYEGFLIPNTYYIPKNESVRYIINYLTNQSEKIHKKLSAGISQDYNTTAWKEIIIKASIIQKEAANNDEMPIVSSVIQNRLEKNMKLQMDGALNYGEYSHIKITPQRIKNDTTKFNTYLYEGLPQSPVCTVSKNAIMAAIYPAQTDFLYFVRDKVTKKHRFSKTHKEHINNVKMQK